MVVRLIGLIGYGGAGKTTVANILRERHGFQGPHIKTPIANMVRSFLRDFGVPEADIDRYIDGDLKREVIPTIGKSSTYLQQTLGFDWGRDLVREDIWLANWLLRAETILGAGGSVVQESVRAPDEVEPIRSRGGIIAEVRRPGVGPLEGGHKSEILPCQPDVVIDNGGNLGHLRLVVSELVAA